MFIANSVPDSTSSLLCRAPLQLRMMWSGDQFLFFKWPWYFWEKKIKKLFWKFTSNAWFIGFQISNPSTGDWSFQRLIWGGRSWCSVVRTVLSSERSPSWSSCSRPLSSHPLQTLSGPLQKNFVTGPDLSSTFQMVVEIFGNFALCESFLKVVVDSRQFAVIEGLMNHHLMIFTSKWVHPPLSLSSDPLLPLWQLSPEDCRQ